MSQPLPIELTRPVSALAGSDVTAFTAMLLEPTHPRRTHVILLRDRFRAQTRITIVDHPLPQIH